MMLRRRFIATTAAGTILAASALACAQTHTTTAFKTGYALVNGLNLYYESHGTGEPLILLHGGLGATEMFGEVLPLLSKTRRVIAVDLQAHGRTADIDRPMTFEAMADDIAALMKHLEIERADVMGYSLGGGVALRTAIQHPDVVRKLVWHGSGMSNARLAILPGLTHYNVFASPALASTVTPFLDAPMPVTK